MSVIATFSVPVADFTLGKTIGGSPSATIRLDRVIPIDDSFIPYFWATDETVDAIEAELRAEADVESFEVVDTSNGEALVRVEWAEEVDGLLAAMGATGASVLEAIGEQDAWRFQLRFDDHDRLSEFFERCAAKGIALDLETVHNPGVHEGVRIRNDLTDEQRETLEAALDRGYFDVPRRINLVELAERLGVSDSAVSQRLRRGVATVLAETALRTAESDEED